MRKITLLFTSLLLSLGAWAQEAKTPVVDLTNIPTNYPYELPATEAEKVFGLETLTIVLKVNTPASMSGRQALFCTSDPTQNANTDAMGTGSHYVAYGFDGENLAYLASCKSGDKFTTPGATANTEGFIVAYVLNPGGNNYKAYANEMFKQDRNFGSYEIATPQMVKEDHPNAKIYIGGGVKNNNANFEVFNGTIVGAKVYNGVLTINEIKEAFPVQVDELKAELNELITAANTLLAKGYACGEITELGTVLAVAQNAYNKADATVEQVEDAIEALTAAYNTAKEYPFVNSLVKTLEVGNYYVYYTDEENTKHYLQTAGNNSVVTVTESPAFYEISAGTTQSGKYAKAYLMKMNSLYISNTSSNATNIETKPAAQLWSSQVVFEKNDKCAIRLTNATDVDQWHGNFFIGKGETEGTTVALDPTTSLEEAMFIWQFEKIEPVALTYTLTDELGNTYAGTYQGVAGNTLPTVAGVSGYTLEVTEWDGTALSAKIVFPFPISDNKTTNATMICAFGMENMKWYANDNNVCVHKNVEPTEDNLTSYHWAIYPAFNNGAFTFTIKNIAAEKFIFSESNENKHEANTVALEDAGSAVTFDNNKFKLATNKYLSVGSTTPTTEQYVGTWDSHNGCVVSFLIVETEEPGQGGETGVNTVGVQETAVIYDLTGRRVEKIQKGIYIVNGKKVVLK